MGGGTGRSLVSERKADSSFCSLLVTLAKQDTRAGKRVGSMAGPLEVPRWGPRGLGELASLFQGAPFSCASAG